ncbi:MAG TPA: thioredoxin domain-containing protein [Chthoniobacterales bacterium]|nr:thioredoxin domain-containing protein [Chthoniobacterales bacterium]
MHHLLNSSSPYLLQHRDNPVSWYPWGDEAIERARAEQKPIFLSIGYSTCHWCHVMAHESFENSEIAKILNEYFICIKVDREERPDIDRLYMAYVQALTGSGGWPLSVWLTPELKPFFGGTYFPPKDSYGRVGFPSVLLQLAQLWKENRSRLEQEALRAMNALHYLAEKKEVSALQSKEASLQRGYEEFLESFDPVWGGFGRAPKFPRPSVLYFILRCQKGVSPRPCSQNPGTDPFDGSRRLFFDLLHEYFQGE